MAESLGWLLVYGWLLAGAPFERPAASDFEIYPTIEACAAKLVEQMRELEARHGSALVAMEGGCVRQRASN